MSPHSCSDDEHNPGLYLERLPDRSWISNSQFIIDTMSRSAHPLAIVDLQKKSLSYVKTSIFSGLHFGLLSASLNFIFIPPENDSGTWHVLDATTEAVLASYSEINLPPVLLLGRFEPDGTIAWTKLTDDHRNSGACCKIMLLAYNHAAVDVVWSLKVFPAQPTSWEAIVVRPASVTSKHPLVVFPHGGPHSVFSSDYFVNAVAFAALGYFVVMVNYRGSSGFGQVHLTQMCGPLSSRHFQASIESLPGKVGVQDVNDVNDAASAVLEEWKGVVDPEQVVAFGGSHGGLLSAHLTGQFPERYKAAGIRNPVIDILSMVAVTDIPDWCAVESGFQYDQDFQRHKLSVAHFEAMRVRLYHASHVTSLSPSHCRKRRPLHTSNMFARQHCLCSVSRTCECRTARL